MREVHVVVIVRLHRRNHHMGPTGRISSIYGDHGDQAYLSHPTFATAIILRSARRGTDTFYRPPPS